MSLVQFYDRSVREVYAYLYRGTAGNRRLTEDLTQETFLACVHAVKSGQGDATTMPWIIGVARHKLIDHYRRHSREERKLSLAWSAAEIAPSDVPFDITEAEALPALQQLSELHRLVLVLRYIDDLPVSEVARSIGRSVRATESLLVRARGSLEENLRGSRDV